MSVSPKQIGKTIAIANLATDSEIAVTGTVEQYRAIVISQTTAGIALTLPEPSDVTIVFSLDIINSGTADFTLHGVNIPAASAVRAAWDGTLWRIGGSGVLQGTLHDAGETAPVAVKDGDHLKLLHLEPTGKGYSFDVADLKDGEVFHITNKSGAAVADAFSFVGFTTVFDQTDQGKAVTAAYALAAEEYRTIRITENGGNWYANITDGIQIYRGDVAPPVPTIPALWYKPVGGAASKQWTFQLVNVSGVRLDDNLVPSVDFKLVVGNNALATLLPDADYPQLNPALTYTPTASIAKTVTIDLAATPIEIGGTVDFAIPLSFNPDAISLEIKIGAFEINIFYGGVLYQHLTEDDVNSATQIGGTPLTAPATPTATDYDLYANIDGAWVLLKKGSASNSTLKSPDTNTYTEIIDGRINFVVDGKPVGNVVWDADLGMPKWTLSGALDPDFYFGNPLTLAQRDALVAKNPAAKAGYFTYVKDTDTAVNEYQFFDGSRWHSLGLDAADALLGAFSGRTIADNVTLKAALQALETKVENIELLGDLIGSFATFADLPAPTADIAHDLAAVQQDTKGTGSKANPQYPAGLYAVNGAGDSWGLILRIVSPGLLTDAQAQSTTDDTAGLIAGKTLYDRDQALKGSAANFAVDDPDYAVAKPWSGKDLAANFQRLSPWLHIPKTELDGYNDGAATVVNVVMWMLVKHPDTAQGQKFYYTGNDDGAEFPTHIFERDHEGTPQLIEAPSSGSANPRKFAPATGAGSVTVVAAGKPTANEIKTWAAAQDPKVTSTLVYYTGTAAGTDNPTYVFDVDSNGEATLLEMPLNASSVTVQTGAHAFGSTGTGTSPSFAVTFPTPFANPPIVELTYRWNYNASTNGTALNPVVIIDGAPSTTGFNYRIIGGRNALDSVSWTAVDAQTSVQAGNQVLTPRDITGSITSKGFDGVTIPYQIPLTAGQVLDTVSLNGAATTDFDASTGIVRITPNGLPIAVTHTTKAGATFSALQWVGEFTPPDNTVYDTLATINTGINFNKCDYIEWQFRLTSDLRTICGFVPRIVGGSTPSMEVCHGQGQISSFIASSADALIGRLTNVDCHGVAFEVIKIRGWALGANKVVVPTASTVLTPRKITGSITSEGYDGVELAYAIPLAIDKVLDTVSLNGTPTTNFDANTGIVRIKPNGGDVAVTHTTKTGSTFTSLQMVGETNHNNTALTTAGVTFTLAAALQEGDLLEVVENYNNNSTETHLHWPRATAGQTFTVYQYPATGNSCTVVFPATLTNQITLKGAANQYIRTIRIWRNAANKVVIPTGTTVATPYAITANGGAAGSFNGHEAIGPETFYLTVPVDQEVDAFPAVAGVTLRNRQAGMFSVDRAVGAGNLALTGITFRAMSGNSRYFGTFVGQAGDTGHAFTRRLFRGSGITTANDTTFTLSGGIYRIRAGITSHYGNATWRTTDLLVDGATVTFMRTGRDGGNWDGSGPIEWVVDATTVNHTVQLRRSGSSGNGNADGWLAIDRDNPVVAPDGTVLYTPRTITGTNVSAPGARDNTVTNALITGIAAGSEIATVSATGGAVVALRNSGRSGTALVDIVPNGADSVITYTTQVWRRALTATVNGAAANVNGAASNNVDATQAVSFALTLPAGHTMTTAPTITNGSLLSWQADGTGSILPTNTGNITIDATTALLSSAKGVWRSNATGAALLGSTSVLTLPSILNEQGIGGVTYDGTTLTIPSLPYPVKLTANIYTYGTGAHYAGVYFRRTADAVGVVWNPTGANNAQTTGVYGQGAPNIPAVVVVPANTPVTLNLVYMPSANNQTTRIGSQVTVERI